MHKAVISHPEKCTGCKICELVCSMQKVKGFSLSHSSIEAVSSYAKLGVHHILVCAQCKRAICAEVCGKKAMRRDEKTNAVLIDNTRCNGCEKCIITCPIRAIKLLPRRELATTCDLCHGDPVCVKYCPTKAIEYTTYEDEQRKKHEYMLKKFELLTSP